MPTFTSKYLPARGVCKGTGLQKLCEIEGVNPQEVVAFGDGDNDMEFLQNSGNTIFDLRADLQNKSLVLGLGVAMANARDVTKAKADIVLEENNDQDGVAVQIERLFKAERL